VIGQAHQATREQRQTLKVDLRLRQLRLEIADAGLAPSAGYPLCGIAVSGHLESAILPEQRGVLLRDDVRVKLATGAAHQINDEMCALLVANGERVAVGANAARGVAKRAIEGVTAARRQFERPTVVDRGLDRLVIQERPNVGAKLGIPLGASSLRVAGASALDHRTVERGVKLLRCARYDEHVRIINAEVVAMLLMQQADAAIGC